MRFSAAPLLFDFDASINNESVTRQQSQLQRCLTCSVSYSWHKNRKGTIDYVGVITMILSNGQSRCENVVAETWGGMINEVNEKINSFKP